MKRILGLLGWLGVVLVLAAVVTRFVKPELVEVYQGLAIAGLVTFPFGQVDSDAENTEISKTVGAQTTECQPDRNAISVLGDVGPRRRVGIRPFEDGKGHAGLVDRRYTVPPHRLGVAEGEAQWNYIQKFKPYAVDLTLDEERLRYMQQLNVDLNVQGKVLPYAQVADMSLAREALALLK